MAEENSSFALALGAVVTGIYIVTVRAGEDETGFLGSFVQQAGFEPPALTVAVKKGRPAEELLRRPGAAVAVNVVAEKGFSLMKHFARGFAPDEPAFEGIASCPGPSGARILPEAMAWVDGTVEGWIESGDHVVFLVRLGAGELQAADVRPEVRVRLKGKGGFDY